MAESFTKPPFRGQLAATLPAFPHEEEEEEGTPGAASDSTGLPEHRAPATVLTDHQAPLFHMMSPKWDNTEWEEQRKEGKSQAEQADKISSSVSSRQPDLLSRHRKWVVSPSSSSLGLAP